MEKFDLIIIGVGPAGYAAAMRGIDFGKRVCLIERNRVGSSGVYNGALSFKTLWKLSSRISSVNNTIVSNGRTPFQIEWGDVKKRSKKRYLSLNPNILVISSFCKLNQCTNF